MENIRGVVERITYQNEENGYTVIKYRVKNDSDLVTVVGMMHGYSCLPVFPESKKAYTEQVRLLEEM